MVNATACLGWGGMGWDDDVLCFCTACLMLRHGDVACMPAHGRCYGMSGVGWDQVSTYRMKKKQVSFIPTRPPTTYVNMRLVDKWWCSQPAVCKTKLNAFAFMLPGWGGVG